MGKYSDPLKLYDAQRARFEAGKMTLRQAHKDISEQGLKDMQELTAGTLTKKQTRGAFARGASPAESTPTGERRRLTDRQIKNRGLEPVAKPKAKTAATSSAAKTVKRKRSVAKKGGGVKGPGQHPVVPLLPINEQSHDLHDSMKLKEVSMGSMQSFEVGPDDVAYAQYILAVGGTVKMVARGFFAEVRKRWKARNKAVFDRYLRKERKD